MYSVLTRNYRLGAIARAAARVVAGCDFNAAKEAFEEFDVIVQLEEINTSASVSVINSQTGSFLNEPVTFRFLGDNGDDVIDMFSDPIEDLEVNGGVGVFGIGKIEDIFAGNGISHARHTGSNAEGLEVTLSAIQGQTKLSDWKISADKPDDVQFIFTNLVDTDSLYGHRRNVEGYAGALTEIDHWLAKIVDSLSAEDLLIISSDHGNDPTAPGTDHTREYVPLLVVEPGKPTRNLGIRNGFYDVAQSVAAHFGLDPMPRGKSFL